MKRVLLFGLLSTIVAVSSCAKGDDVLTKTNQEAQSMPTQDHLNHFPNADRLRASVWGLSEGQSFRSLSMSGVTDKGQNQHLMEQVPNVGFRRLLLPRGRS